jgi:CheY-like chemotaxis protein
MRPLNLSAVRVLSNSTAMLISLCQWELSHALPLLNFQTDRSNHIMLAWPKRWKYRILYVGRDLALTAFLKDALNPLDCYIVRCPRGTEARIFIESEMPYVGGSAIKYSLFLFDEELPDMTGKELADFTHKVKHRKKIPILIIERTDDRDRLASDILRLLRP